MRSSSSRQPGSYLVVGDVLAVRTVDDGAIYGGGSWKRGEREGAKINRPGGVQDIRRADVIDDVGVCNPSSPFVSPISAIQASAQNRNTIPLE